MLVFPERVLQGDIPNKDFLHLYGPGSLWALAGVFKVFGVSLLTERFFGLAQQMAVVFGIYALARPWGRRLAVGLRAPRPALILVPFGLTALAWVGALGLGLFGLTCGLVARRRTDERVARRWALLAGLLLGLALLFRPDLVARGRPRHGRARARARSARVVTAGCSRAPRSGSSPYVVHVAHRRARQRHRRDDPRPGVPPARRPQPADPAVVGAPRRLPAAGGRTRTAVVADPGARAVAAAVRVVLRPPRLHRVARLRRVAAAPAGAGRDADADVGRRRAVQHRARAPSRAARRLRALRLGRLRADGVPADRRVRTGAVAEREHATCRPAGSRWRRSAGSSSRSCS